MQKKVFFIISVCTLLVSLHFFNISEALEVAQVEPAKVRLSILPGASRTGTVKIYNLSGDPKNIKAYLEDWVYLPPCDGTKDFKPSGTTALSAARWITFFPSEFIVPAYGKQIVNYTVSVPQDKRGGHYAVLFFENYMGDPKKAKEGVNINLAVRIATLFYIESADTVKRQIKIDKLKIIKEEEKRLKISAWLQNIGNVDVSLKGNFFIIDSKGMVYARGDFNDLYTFPGDAAELLSYWKDAIPKGKYDLVITLDISKPLEESGLGKVPAITKEASLEIGEKGEILSVSELK